MHIKHVWTAKQHRGKGHAKKLFQEVFRFAKEQNYPFAFIDFLWEGLFS